MKPYHLSFLSCLLPLMITANNPQGVVESNNRFAFKLFHQVQSSAPGNQFYSPFSISTALAMVYAGARNETALQMSRTMNFLPGNQFHSGYKHLLSRLHEGADHPFVFLIKDNTTGSILFIGKIMKPF